MRIVINRRHFLKTASILGGSLILAPTPGCFITDEDRRVYNDLTGAIKGKVAVDQNILTQYSSDYAGFIMKTPKYVVFPQDEADCVKVLQVANQHKIKVTVRGQGHGLGGQSLNEGGILLVTASDGEGLIVTDNGYRASGGMTWLAVEQGLNKKGESFPVLTNYLGLSVGGTLAHAGIGRASVKYGHQIENIDAIRLLTPDGEIRHCSKTENADFFKYGMASLGQMGIILDVDFSRVKPLKKTKFLYTSFDNVEDYIKLSDLILSDYFDDIDYYVGYYFSDQFMIGIGKDFESEAQFDKTSFAKLSVHFNDEYTETLDNFNMWMHGGLVEQITGNAKDEFSFKDKAHVWDHYLFPRDEYFEFLRMCFAPGREIGVNNTSPLINSYVINNRKKSVHPFSPSYNFDNEAYLMNIGFLANVPLTDQESLQFYRERSDEYLKWCVDLKGRPYLYGNNSANHTMKEVIYGEHLGELQTMRQRFDPNDILNSGLII